MTTPKLPIYPRPVSPLTAEPLRSAPWDIYLDDLSDSHIDDEEHAAKWRRIEKLGEQYLRGEGLFIMTAALRGPMTEWKNSWRKRDRQAFAKQERVGTTRQDMRAEIPETVRRLSGQSKHAALNKVEQRGFGKRPSPQNETHKAALDGQNWLKTVEDKNQQATAAREDSPTPVRQYCKVRNMDDSTFKKLQDLRTSSKAASSHSRHAAPVSTYSARDDKSAAMPILSSETTEKRGPEVEPLPEPKSLPFDAATADAATAESTRSVVAEILDTEFIGQFDSRSKEAAEGHGALNLNSKAARISLKSVTSSSHIPDCIILPAADLVNDLEYFQAEQTNSGRHPDDIHNPQLSHSSSSTEVPITEGLGHCKGRTNLEKRSEGIITPCDGGASKTASEMLNLDKAGENASSRPKNMPPPSLSAQTSTTTDTNALPSAQFVPGVQPASAEPYSSTAGKMIDLETTPTEGKAGEQHSSFGKWTLPVTNGRRESGAVMLAKNTTSAGDGTSLDHTNKLPRLCNREGIVPFGTFESPPSHTYVREPDTQAMLAAINPLGFSTVEKIPLKLYSEVTPATATRTKPQKRKKQASFAPSHAADAASSGSSQGSIKDSLKVTKRVVTRPKIAGLNQQSEPSPYGKLGLDMDTSDEDGVAAAPESMLELSFLQRGELQQQDAAIPSGPLPGALTLASTGSVEEQDAQQEHGRRLHVRPDIDDGQADFNLASAMDDLGSFLGTWDADKEAREIGSATSGSCVKSALKSRVGTNNGRT